MSPAISPRGQTLFKGSKGFLIVLFLFVLICEEVFMGFVKLEYVYFELDAAVRVVNHEIHVYQYLLEVAFYVRDFADCRWELPFFEQCCLCFSR